VGWCPDTDWIGGRFWGQRRDCLVLEGREPGTGLDVPFGRFQRILRRAIGTEYVEDPAKEVAPGVLAW
jgi:hypothetical protein